MVTLQIVPYSEIEGLTSIGRIRKLLNIAKEDKIALLQGRLKKEEEAELIKVTMEEINKDFKGVELAVLDPTTENVQGFGAIKKGFLNMILGDRQGLTVVGPANVVKQIKRDPGKIELFTQEVSKKRNKKK
ncbi:DUF2073 domain-containing protein [Candidatus Woesearchaeota archaeon]|nr:DUF2073 domain-containing protein [Candidatus Woesearchaeota archaeon]